MGHLKTLYQRHQLSFIVGWRRVTVSGQFASSGEIYGLPGTIPAVTGRNSDKLRSTSVRTVHFRAKSEPDTSRKQDRSVSDSAGVLRPSSSFNFAHWAQYWHNPKKNCPFGVNAKMELKNTGTTFHKNGIRQGVFQQRSVRPVWPM